MPPDFDAIVLGMDAAGLTAAILARDGGARVAVFENTGPEMSRYLEAHTPVRRQRGALADRYDLRRHARTDMVFEYPAGRDAARRCADASANLGEPVC